MKGTDWPSADIKAELEKRGVSLRELSRRNGLSAQTIGNALRYKYPKAQRIIAEAIGVPPEEIWPSRY
ncbi:transcriptional regulator [Salmonella enterica]|uniref:DNA-binding protein n=1 Tax=Salmonella enterica TaxID=28901 RepID=A0A3F3I844_SALER|nr:helix-turn-helix transcriptional regulator [Salmonella enterica]EAU5655750.1 transcriptional regulator [Salmonella enterica]EBI9053747.1 transcriptional regulator [Salmonella enterica]EBR0844822.1 transcriptional regulator [Salmonella enterica]EEK4996632.1 transcriptional regulator [Salmonella enterica]EHD9189122.1 transcriptional regulator [Salmonella enterica]